MEPHFITIQNELSSMRGKLDGINDKIASDRINITEDVYAIRVAVTAFEARLKVLEDSMIRIMSNSTWLLRLIGSGVLVALTQFVMNGGLSLVN